MRGSYPAVPRMCKRIYVRVTDEMVVVLAVLHLRHDPRTWCEFGKVVLDDERSGTTTTSNQTGGVRPAEPVASDGLIPVVNVNGSHLWR